MDKLAFLIGPLGCGVMMVVCMAMMAKGMRRGHDTERPEDDEIAALRAEVAQLRTEQSPHPTSIDG